MTTLPRQFKADYDAEVRAITSVLTDLQDEKPFNHEQFAGLDVLEVEETVRYRLEESGTFDGLSFSHKVDFLTYLYNTLAPSTYERELSRHNVLGSADPIGTQDRADPKEHHTPDPRTEALGEWALACGAHVEAQPSEPQESLSYLWDVWNDSSKAPLELQDEEQEVDETDIMLKYDLEVAWRIFVADGETRARQKTETVVCLQNIAEAASAYARYLSPADGEAIKLEEPLRCAFDDDPSPAAETTPFRPLTSDDSELLADLERGLYDAWTAHDRLLANADNSAADLLVATQHIAKVAMAYTFYIVLTRMPITSSNA